VLDVTPGVVVELDAAALLPCRTQPTTVMLCWLDVLWLDVLLCASSTRPMAQLRIAPLSNHLVFIETSSHTTTAPLLGPQPSQRRGHLVRPPPAVDVLFADGSATSSPEMEAGIECRSSRRNSRGANDCEWERDYQRRAGGMVWV
jgi:hypothetical protein